MGRAPVDHRPPARTRLTVRRLVGLDRSGPPPRQTLPGEPLRPWTIPNAIGYVRLALIPAFLVLALASEEGTDPLPAVIFAVIAWSDYADGIAARLTGQYSRLGVLLDPVVDRLLVISGVAVCWHFELLPRWLLAVLVTRELIMLLVGHYAVRRGLMLQVNWAGRWAVWPTMSALFFALCGLTTLATALLGVGVALSLIASVQYGRRMITQLGETEPSTGS